ncbi:MAG: AAA family ATPase [Gemmatimonadales bacterium]|jgi:hypothetical protein
MAQHHFLRALPMGTPPHSVESAPLSVPQAGTGSTTAPEWPGIVIHSLADLLANASILQPPKIVVPGLAWAGRVTLLAAREKSGKSTLVSAAASTVSRGGYFLDEFTDCGKVLWLSADNESQFDLVARFQRFRAEPQNLDIVGEWDFAPASFLRAVRDRRPRLAVVDTLAAFAAFNITDAHNSAAWTPLMLEIKKAANDSGSAIILGAHANKSDGHYRDSSAIGATVDCILEMEADDRDSNLRRIRARARWQVDGYSLRLVGDTYELANAAPLTLEARILLYLERHPDCSRTAIRNAIGVRHCEVDNCLEVLERKGAIEDRGAGNHYMYHRSNPSVPVGGLSSVGADGGPDGPPLQRDGRKPLRDLAGRVGADGGAVDGERRPPREGGSMGPPAGQDSWAAESEEAA